MIERLPSGFAGVVFCFNASGPQKSSSTNTTRTQDERVTTGAGSPVAVTDSAITTGGGAVTFQTADPMIAKAAIDSAQSLAQGAFGTASSLSQASNTIAAQVADSQRSFVETASGQKTILWVVLGFAALVIAPALFGKAKG